MRRPAGNVSGLPPALAEGLTPAPGDHPDDRHGGGLQALLEVRARPADGLTPAQINAPDPLAEATFDTRPPRVLDFELRRRLAWLRRPEGLVMRLRPGSEEAWGRWRRRARAARGTRATGRPTQSVQASR